MKKPIVWKTTGCHIRTMLVAGLLSLGISHALPSMAASPRDPDIDRLNQLVTNNQYADAYGLATQLLKEHEGEPEFDFLYGLSALEVGKPNEAIFAFERITYAYPEQMRVKLELARAFYEINNFQSSKQLFNEVLASNPTENVKKNIKAFLDQIEEKENNIAGNLDWFISANIGSDSNINSATKLGVIPTPIGDVQLSANGTSIKDDFSDISGGAVYNKPFSKTSGITLNGNFSRHNNFSSNDFDIDVLAGDATYFNVNGNIRMSYGVRGQRVDLNGQHFQDSGSLMVTMQRAPGDGWVQALTGAYTAVRYDDAINANASLRDVNQALVSGVLGKSIGRFNHSVSVYLGDEQAVNAAGDNNAQQFYGVVFSEQYQLNSANLPYFRLTVHHSDNKNTDPIFNVERSDKTISASLGWMWQVSNNLSVSSDATYSKNDSNIVLYAYSRVKFQTGVRYQF